MQKKKVHMTPLDDAKSTYIHTYIHTYVRTDYTKLPRKQNEKNRGPSVPRYALNKEGVINVYILPDGEGGSETCIQNLYIIWYLGTYV